MNQPVSPRERLKIPRQKMPEQQAQIRKDNFLEVNLGFDEAAALREAQRCLGCTSPKCVQGCPVGVKVKEFIELIVDREYLKAAAKLREDNVLPAVTGRVCPQEEQCEGACILAKRGESVGIGYLERFVADFERSAGVTALPERLSPSGKRIELLGAALPD